MVNTELEEHKDVLMIVNKRTYHMITGMFADKHLDIKKFVKVYIEKT